MRASTGGFGGEKENMTKEKETENRSERELFLDRMLKEILSGQRKPGDRLPTESELAEQYGATVTGVDDLNQTFELLLSGRIDATLNAEMTFYDYTKEHPDANVKIAVLTDDANQIAIPMRKGDETAALRTAIDAAIDELRADGTLKALSEKYFGRDISTEE